MDIIRDMSSNNKLSLTTILYFSIGRPPFVIFLLARFLIHYSSGYTKSVMPRKMQFKGSQNLHQFLRSKSLSNHTAV